MPKNITRAAVLEVLASQTAAAKSVIVDPVSPAIDVERAGGLLVAVEACRKEFKAIGDDAPLATWASAVALAKSKGMGGKTPEMREARDAGADRIAAAIGQIK